MYEYHYLVEVPGITLGCRIDWSQISPFLKNASAEQRGASEILIRVVKSRTWPEEIAKKEAFLEVEDLLDRLSLIDNHSIGELKFLGYEDDAGNFHKATVHVGDCANLTAGLQHPLAYYSAQGQAKLLVGRLNPLTRLHRTTQGMPNGIGKYLLLYGALQVLYGDKQADVDAQLQRIRPDTLMVQGRHRRETIVSHLRNMIAHPEDYIDLQTLVAQVELYCPMLSEILRDELRSRVQQ